MDIVMHESLLPRALFLSPAKIQMSTWKPDITWFVQQLQDFDNEGFNVSKILFNIVQDSKLNFSQYKEVFLFWFTIYRIYKCYQLSNKIFGELCNTIFALNFEEL